MASKSGFLPALTGIRGIAAIWVVMRHIADASPVLLGSQMTNSLFVHGYFGADLFFILSGFIITHIHYQDFEESLTENLRPFLVLRAFRVYPLHVAVMLIMLAIVVIAPDFADYQIARDNAPSEYEAITFVTSILLVQGITYKFPLGWNIPAWTVSVLMFAYFIFPVLAFALRFIKKPAVNLVLALGLLTVFGMVMGILGLLDVNAVYLPGIARGFAGFIAGALLNRFFAKNRELFPAFLVCASSLGIIVLATFFELFRPFIYLGIGLLVLSLAYYPILFSRIFGKGVVLRLGEISFSIYLTQMVVIGLTCWFKTNWMPDAGFAAQLVLIAAMLVMIALVSELSFRYIENPARQYGWRVAAAHRQ